MVLTDATSGHSKDIDRSARHYLDTHGMAGCFCNHSKDPNATISWTLVSAEDAPLHALVPTIVSLRRIEAGEFVMLGCWMRYSMDNGHPSRPTSPRCSAAVPPCNHSGCPTTPSKAILKHMTTPYGTLYQISNFPREQNTIILNRPLLYLLYTDFTI
mgnify:CR=1 FL=1